MNARQTPYYAVIFSSRLTDDIAGYSDMAERTEQLAKLQPGYLGFESARNAEGLGISVSYWRDTAAIQAWREHIEHQSAIELGYQRWYQQLHIRIARVERSYDWERT